MLSDDVPHRFIFKLMVHDSIHLIWFDDAQHPVALAAAEHWNQFGGGRWVILHTDDSLLLPQWRAAWTNHATTPLKKSDLLRWSILLSQGGWYFDCDVRTRLPLNTVEAEGVVSREKCFVTFMGSAHAFPRCDVLACSPDWPGKADVINYVASVQSSADPMVFAFSMLQPILESHPEWFCWGPTNRYAYCTADPNQRVFNPDGDFGPFKNVLVVRKKGETAVPSLTEAEKETVGEGANKLKLSALVARRYAAAILKWSRAGWSRRTPDEVKAIFRTKCLPCPERQRGKCKKCGCRVSEGTIALVNKIRMATEHCPKTPAEW